MKTPTPCPITGCRNRVVARGFCQTHYHRHRITENLLPRCAVIDCDGGAVTRGWCPKHYQRYQRHGDPTALVRREQGTGYITTTGYRGITVEGRKILEHRSVWETTNGPIPNGMVVHHRNGDKLDNRLENLELLSISAHMRLHHPKDTRPCTTDGCTEVRTVRGLCSRHYQEWRAKNTERPRCTTPNCTRAAIARTLCNTHYQALRRRA